MPSPSYGDTGPELSGCSSPPPRGRRPGKYPDANFPEGVVASIIAVLRANDFVVFFQVGNVSAARQAVKDGADVIVAQGIDAGGHQFVNGCGVISLDPEVVDMVEREFPEKGVVVVSAGGIADGRGVVACMALGECLYRKGWCCCERC